MGLNLELPTKRCFMKFSETIMPISEAKAHTARLVAAVADSRCPVFITQNGRARVVVEDIRTYQETRETLAFLKLVAMGRRDVESGRHVSVDEAFGDVRAKLASGPNP